MSNKRRPTSELTHDNWNEEEEPEEPGTFQKASDDVLSRRVVKAARRRMTHTEDGPTKSAFGSFTGFKSTGTPNTASPFSFIKSNSSTNSLTSTSSTLSTTKSLTSNGSLKVSENGIGSAASSAVPSMSIAPKSSSTDKESASSPKRPPEYYAKLKGLNQSVAQWIKTHVDSNPVCILTPIFRDYEKYLKEIELKHGKVVDGPKVAESKPETKTETPKSTDTFQPASADKKTTNIIFSGSDVNQSKSEGESIFGNMTNSTKSRFSSSSFKSDNKSPFSSSPSASFDKNIFSSKPAFETKKDEESEKSEEIKPEENKPSTGLVFPQTTSSSGLFSFGQNSSTTSTASAAVFSFGSGKPFSFGTAAVAKPQDSEEKKDEDKEDEDEEPPKPEFKPVTEEGSIFDQRCKVYVKKKDSYSELGVGTLFLKPTPNDKMQLIVRAVNSLGNIILNTLLTESMPVKKLNKNTIMLVCLPTPTATPPPVPTLLRVKTEEEANKLLETLEKNKK